MKNLLVILALAVSQFAAATSIRDVRLHYRSEPYGPFAHSNKTKISLVVYVTGEVVKFTCPTGTRFNKCESKKVTQLSSYKMDKIERDIQLAADGEIRYPQPSDIICKAIPHSMVEMTADNEKVFLRKGASPCGRVTRNTSPSAERLVEELRKLVIKGSTQE